MWTKIKKYLTDRNWGLKIASLVAAVVLWLAVVNLDNPDITKTFTVPVNITGEELLEQIEKVYEVVGNTNVATIHVTGERSLVDSLNVSDFVATADLNQIIDIQEDGNQKLVPIEVTVRKNADKLNITQKTTNLKIALEDLSSDQTYVSVDTIGNVADGYAIGDVIVSPNLVTISGPESLVSKINKVVANVNISGLYEDCTINVPLTLYDGAGNRIESSQIKLSQDSVTASVQILGTKVVPVRCEISGTPADGYIFEGLEYAPETIQIKGIPSKLNKIQEIVIPGDAINLDGAKADVENSIDINPYLPEGVSLLNAEEGRVAVKAVVVALQSKTLELLLEDITVLNLHEKYEIKFNNTKLLIPVRGKAEDMESLTIDKITASINLEDLEPGMHVVDVDLTLDERYEVTKQITVRLSIKEMENAPEDPDVGGSGEDDGNNNPTDPENGENNNENNEGTNGEEGTDTPGTGGSGEDVLGGNNG